MAESSISVLQRTPNTTPGTNETVVVIDLWPVVNGGTTYNRQAVVLGDPTTAGGVAKVDSVAGLSVAQSSDSLNTSGVPVSPQFAPVSLSASGSVIAAVATKRIRVLSYLLVCTVGNVVTWQTSTGNAALSGAMSFNPNGGVAAPFSQVGHFQTAVGDALQLNLGSAGQVSGHLTYIVV